MPNYIAPGKRPLSSMSPVSGSTSAALASAWSGRKQFKTPWHQCVICTTTHLRACLPACVPDCPATLPRTTFQIIITTPSGALRMVTGASGGPRIISATYYSVSRSDDAEGLL